MIAKYRKKPVVIEAVQWTGDNLAEIWEWAGTDIGHRSDAANPNQLLLTTIHGEQAIARVGDWVISEPAVGRFYPHTPDVFEATYELVESRDGTNTSTKES